LVRKSADGFDADIADLDLSFLESDSKEQSFNLQTTFEVKMHQESYKSNQQSSSDSFMNIETKNEYSSLQDNVCIRRPQMAKNEILN